MAFTKVSGKKNYLGGYQDKDGAPKFGEGEILVEGWYKGTVHNKFNPDKPNFEFRTKDESVVLNNAGHLNYLMRENVEEGDYVRISYAGKEVVSSGAMKGKECHQFELEMDDERSERVQYVEEEVPAETSNEDLSLDDLD